MNSKVKIALYIFFSKHKLELHKVSIIINFEDRFEFVIPNIKGI